MTGVAKDGPFARRDSDARQPLRKVGKRADFDRGRIVESAFIARVCSGEAEAKGCARNRMRDRAQMRAEGLPQRGDPRAFLEAEIAAQAGKQHGLPRDKAIGRDHAGGLVRHAEWLRDWQVGEGAPGPEIFRRHAELIPEGAGESLVRPVANGERDLENVRRAVGKKPRRLAEPAGARKREHRLADDGGECARQVKAREPGHAGHISEREGLADVAFDIPERPADRLHAAPSEAEAMIASTGAACLIGIAFLRLSGVE